MYICSYDELFDSMQNNTLNIQNYTISNIAMQFASEVLSNNISYFINERQYKNYVEYVEWDYGIFYIKTNCLYENKNIYYNIIWNYDPPSEQLKEFRRYFDKYIKMKVFV